MGKIEAARKRAGLTRRQLAEAVGVSVMSIFRYEKGRRIPQTLVLLRLADVLGCKPGELIDA